MKQRLSIWCIKGTSWALVMIGLIMQGCLDPVDTPTVTPDPIVDPTPTATPKVTPSPTFEPTPTPTFTPEPTPPLDADDDGYTFAEDCNDTDNTIYPGADEICDDIDQDCDEDPINDSATTYYEDLDDDGYGDPSSVDEFCFQPVGYVAIAGDCNDDAITINPSSPELCDAIDNNCDSSVDENCWDQASWDQGKWGE